MVQKCSWSASFFSSKRYKGITPAQERNRFLFEFLQTFLTLICPTAEYSPNVSPPPINCSHLRVLCCKRSHFVCGQTSTNNFLGSTKWAMDYIKGSRRVWAICFVMRQKRLYKRGKSGGKRKEMKGQTLRPAQVFPYLLPKI